MMPSANTVVRTEIHGVELRLNDKELSLWSNESDVFAAMLLSPEAADRLRLEMFKAQLPEWNQLEEAKHRTEQRARRYLGAWLVMCLAAFSAYLGYPSYYLCLFLAALSIFLWWRTGYEEQKADREAQAERNKFRADWNYLRDRLEETSDADRS